MRREKKQDIKEESKKDEILFVDARNVFTQVDRAHRKFSDEQIKNLAVISRLYEGDIGAFEDLLAEYKQKANNPEQKEYFEAQINWLLERFPYHKYQDVIGLCKVAKIAGEDGIEDQDWSLNAGRYVGVVIEDDGMTEDEFKKYMTSLNDEFVKLSEEAKTLEDAITKNIKGLFGG